MLLSFMYDHFKSSSMKRTDTRKVCPSHRRGAQINILPYKHIPRHRTFSENFVLRRSAHCSTLYNPITEILINLYTPKYIQKK